MNDLMNKSAVKFVVMAIIIAVEGCPDHQIQTSQSPGYQNPKRQKYIEQSET